MRIDRWAAVVPELVASHQVAWERRQAIRRAVEAGASQREISESIGLSAGRVWQLVRKARGEAHQPSPAEQFLAKRERFRRRRDFLALVRVDHAH